MARFALGTLLVVCLFLPALAEDGPEDCGRPQLNVTPLSELLNRSAESLNLPRTAGMLRAVAELLDQEPVYAPVARVLPPVGRLPAPVAISPMDLIKPVPAEQRVRLAIHLGHAPAVDVAEAVKEFLDRQQKTQEGHAQRPNLNRVVFVAEPSSNCLLISGPPKMVDPVTELVAKLDIQPDMVMVNVCIAEWVLSPDDAKTDDRTSGPSDDSAMRKVPSMQEDGAAWLTWAKKDRRFKILSQPQIMTLDNQPAFIKIGSTVPMVASKPARADRFEQGEIGLIFCLTPRILPEGQVAMELDLQRKSIVNRDKQSGPTIGTTTVQTTISAKDGQTIVQSGLVQRTEGGSRQLIIALTPQINPTR